MALSINRKLLIAFYTFLLIFGIGIYLTWGILFGVWWDVGLYSVVVTLISFGLVGILLYSQQT